MSMKRKSTALGLERRVRARREEDWQQEAEAEADGSSADSSASEASADDLDVSDEASDSGSDASSDAASDREDHAQVAGLASISFGALARAAESLPPSQRSRKPASSKPGPSHDAPAPARAERTGSSKARDKQQQHKDLKRSSKHAPQEVSSKKPVSRRREILPDERRKARDPRFDPLVGRVDEARVAKAYAFLDEYRESEMAELRAQIKGLKGKTRAGDEEKREALKRQLLSMESKKKARAKKEEEARLLEEHRKREKELVAQGKRPFYLKESERKKQMLVKRFEGMSKGQVDRAIERKRKKVASKEKKELASLERRRN